MIDTALSVNRATGALSTKAINYTGGITGTGDVVVFGDLKTYRAGSPNTGVLYMNQAATAYHHFDGSQHNFVGGSLSTNGATLFSGSLNCRDIYTNGYPVTCWGMTSHGAITVNAGATINGQLTLSGQTSNMIQMYDTDWGPMYIHHQNENIGFLSNGGGWIWYVNNNGHFWTPQYGWLHDYVTGTASNYAWYAADVRYSQTIQQFRMAYGGEWSLDTILYYIAGTNIWEPHGNSAITGVGVSQYYTTYIWAIRVRQNQAYRPDWGGWYAVGVA